MPSDTSEKGLESLIVAALTGTRSDAAPTDDGIRDPRLAYGGTGYVLGAPQDYDRDHAVDLAKLLTFLQTTQLKTFGPGSPRRPLSATQNNCLSH